METHRSAARRSPTLERRRQPGHRCRDFQTVRGALAGKSGAGFAVVIGEVTTATKEQSSGIELLNKSVNQMETTTQQNAASAEESASAATELNSQAEMLLGAVSELFAFVDGSQTEASETGHPADLTNHAAPTKSRTAALSA